MGAHRRAFPRGVTKGFIMTIGPSYISRVRILRSALRIVKAHKDEFGRLRTIGAYMLLRATKELP
jgi:hypothetical protein